MVISASYAGFLFIIASLTVSIGLWFLATRVIRKMDAARSPIAGLGALFALSSGIIGGTITWSSFTTHVIEISGTDTHEFVVVGSIDYIAGDNQHVPVESKEDEYYVVNTTDDLLVKEYVEYGLGFGFNNLTPLPAHGYLILHNEPDYYPWQAPPQQIESTLMMDSKSWIRKARADD